MELGNMRADHGHGDIVDLQLPAHDVLRTAEAFLPRGIVENGDRVSARSAVLLRGEEAAPCRTDAQRREVVGGHQFPEDGL
jgi:hypothetical protein